MARCVGRVIGPLAAAFLATRVDLGLGFIFAAAVLAVVCVLAATTEQAVTPLAV
jgi:hypothetical protein